MRHFKDYIWERVRFGMITSWVLLSVVSILTYGTVIAFLKDKELASHLHVAAYTVRESVRAGDWPLALGHLTTLEKTGPVFGIQLHGKRGEGHNLTGPFGERPVGIGKWCEEAAVDSDLTLNGCMRVFGRAEIYTLFLFVCLSAVLLRVVYGLFGAKLFVIVDRISQELRNMRVLKNSRQPEPPPPTEESIVEIDSIREYIVQLLGETEKACEAIALNRLSAQVAHDIRSPLAALDMVVKNSAKFPESERILVRTAVSRITDIANNLISQYSLVPSDGGEGPKTSSGTKTPHLIFSVIESVVSEKRMQFRSRLGVEISAKNDPDSYGLFATIDSSELKRVLSNLINNSVEAIPDSGRVDVALKGSNGRIEVRVVDTGKGIPPETLPKLLKERASFGKDGGIGLGLSHAREAAESWGGSIGIKSTVGAGTTVLLTLPQASPPAWFVRELQITKGGTVVVVDDDPSIHQVWDGRFSALDFNRRNVGVVHITTPSQLMEWTSNRKITDETLFLVDYELLGYPASGLDLIQALNIWSRSILVTSRYEEQSILDRCGEMGLKLIPKAMAALVPITVHAGESVLIDDDPVVHMMWKDSAQGANKKLTTFSSVDEFLTRCAEFASETPVYLDSNLGGGTRGEVLAVELHSRGFTEIYLVTGYSPTTFEPRPEIRAILGKQPPWA